MRLVWEETKTGECYGFSSFFFSLILGLAQRMVGVRWSVLEELRRGSEDRVHGFRSCGSWSFRGPGWTGEAAYPPTLVMVPEASLLLRWEKPPALPGSGNWR